VGIHETGHLHAWVDGFGYQGADGEDPFVDAPEWFAAGCAFEGFETEGVLTQGEGTFVAEVALAQPFKVLWLDVVGAVEDTQVHPAAYRDARLDQAAADPGEIAVWLDNHAFAAGRGEFLPPGGTGGGGVGVGGVDDEPAGGLYQVGSGLGDPVRDAQMQAGSASRGYSRRGD
jgi:hypothetical protein